MLSDCPYSWDNLSKDAVATYSEPNLGIGNPGNYGCFLLPMMLHLEYYTQEI